ncbi:hypothetical protein GCM10010317_079290 [Streptomyces mirabilis]|nr:hypothetical protein GCM10010317_079290 [Streptomyces mirabilis]
MCGAPFSMPVRASPLASDRVPIPPDVMELCLAGGRRLGGAPDRTWVVSCRAVVKIYHGRNMGGFRVM